MVTLPTTTWGEAGGRRALLLHGINGAGAGWWRIGDALAADGWHVTAVDLRGHGSAPRASDYRIADYVADLPGADWDVVVGHSLGAAIATVAAERPGFARRLVLLDPVLQIPAEQFDAVYAEQAAELTATAEELALERPLWHSRDIELKIAASARADRGMVDGTFGQNRPWDILDDARRLTVPTLIIGADPAVYTFFPVEIADAVASEYVTVRRVAGAGHSPHRDRPIETISLLREWLLL